MTSKLKHYTILTAGWFFVTLGIIGILLPVVPQAIPLLIGFYLLSLRSARARLLLRRFRHKYPKLFKKYEVAKIKADKIMNKIFKNTKKGNSKNSEKSNESDKSNDAGAGKQ